MSRDLERRNRALAELARARDRVAEAEMAFDSIRNAPGYGEVRAKCR